MGNKGGKVAMIKPETQKAIEESWALVTVIEKEDPGSVGVMIFKKLFELEPDMLQIWTFRDEPNLYESRELKHHGIITFRHVAMAVEGLSDPEWFDKHLKKVGMLHQSANFHMGLNMQRFHFDQMGVAFMQTLEFLLKVGFFCSLNILIDVAFA